MSPQSAILPPHSLNTYGLPKSAAAEDLEGDHSHLGRGAFRRTCDVWIGMEGEPNAQSDETLESLLGQDVFSVRNAQRAFHVPQFH